MMEMVININEEDDDDDNQMKDAYDDKFSLCDSYEDYDDNGEISYRWC